MLDYLAVGVNSSIYRDKEFRTKIWKSFHEIFGAWNQAEKRRVNEANRLKKALDDIKTLKEEAFGI